MVPEAQQPALTVADSAIAAHDGRRRQNPRSWLFYDGRIRAGIETMGELADWIDASTATLFLWQQGYGRPSGRHMLRLEEALKIPLPDLVATLWKEKIGDPCPCKCGGKKAFPEDPDARRLVIKRACVKCPSEQIYTERRRHSKLCKTCSHSVEPIKGLCAGYKYRGEKYRNQNCERTKELKPHEVHRKQWIKKHVQPNSDFKAHKNGFTYKCSHCSGELQRIKGAEKHLRKFWEKRYPHDNFPKIRGKNHLFKLRSIHGPEMLAESARKARESRKANETVAPRKSRSTAKSRSNVIRAWAGPDLPNIKLCIFCNTLTNGPQCHGECYREWRGRVRGLHQRLPPRRRGRPVTDLNRYFSWAVQHYVGTFEVEKLSQGRKRTVIKKKSYRRIAKENKTDFNFVSDKIKFIIERLPERASARLRRCTEVLRASLKELLA